MYNKKQTYKSSPFGKGRNPSLNACVGQNGGPYDYASYGVGYFQAGNLIGRYIVETRDASGELPIDIAFYPLLYMYRQGSELMMKHFIYDKKNAPENPGQHNLKKLWKKAKSELLNLFKQQYGLNESSEYITKIENFILKLHELDPEGEVMRFPEDIAKNKFLQEYSIINIEPIYTDGLEVSRIFEILAHGREELGFM